MAQFFVNNCLIWKIFCIDGVCALGSLKSKHRIHRTMEGEKKSFQENLNFILNRYVCFFVRGYQCQEKNSDRKTNFGEGVNLINFSRLPLKLDFFCCYGANIIKVSITCRVVGISLEKKKSFRETSTN